MHQLIKTIILAIFLLSGIALISCEKKTIEKRELKELLFDTSGENAYEIEGIAQGLKGLQKDYETYISMNYPSQLKKMALISSVNWKEYVQQRQKQDLMFVDAIKKDIASLPEFEYFLRQGIRDAIVKAYLYKSLSGLDKIKQAQFSEDRVYLEKIYQENQAEYDKKKISKENAIESLRKVYAQKKKALIDYLLVQEQTKTIETLKKNSKIQENPKLYENPMQENLLGKK